MTTSRLERYVGNRPPCGSNYSRAACGADAQLAADHFIFQPPRRKCRGNFENEPEMFTRSFQRFKNGRLP